MDLSLIATSEKHRAAVDDLNALNERNAKIAAVVLTIGVHLRSASEALGHGWTVLVLPDGRDFCAPTPSECFDKLFADPRVQCETCPALFDNADGQDICPACRDKKDNDGPQDDRHIHYGPRYETPLP